MLLQCTEDPAASHVPRLTFLASFSHSSGDFAMPFHRGAMLGASFPSSPWSSRRSPLPRKAATPEPCAAPSPIPPAPSFPTQPSISPTRSADSTAPQPPTPPASSVFSNVPFNPYTIDVSAKGFAPLSQNVEIRSSVGTTVKLVLQIAGASQTVTVESGAT